MTTNCKLNNQFAILWNKNCIQMFNLDGEFGQKDLNFYIPIKSTKKHSIKDIKVGSSQNMAIVIN